MSPPSPAQSRRLLPAVTLALAVGAGCNGCDDRKPYTPYTLASTASADAAPSAPSEPADASASLDAGEDAGFTVESGEPAPGDGKSWALDGGAIVPAPTGRSFATGLVLDVDGDGRADLLAWARSADGLRGELVLAHAATPSELTTVAAMPSSIGGQGCQPSVKLARLGVRTAALDVDLRCHEHEGRATRWIAVLALPGEGLRAPELRLELQLGAGKSAPPGLALDAADHDADGREDLTVTFTAPPPHGLAAPSAAPTAVARFFDRPAGLSRDASEPEASLRAQADQLLARARGKSPGDVAPDAAALRRLRDALCGADASVTTGAGPLTCGDGRSVEVSWLAEGMAALVMGDVLGAMQASGELRRGKAESSRQKDLEREIAKAAPSREALVVRRAAAKPDGDGSGLGPLRFETTGALLVRTAEGVVRVDADTGDEQATEDVSRWASALTLSGEARTLERVDQRCDPPALTAHLVTISDEAPFPPVAVPLPLFGGRDASGAPAPCSPIERLRLVPVDVEASRCVVALGDELVSIARDGDGFSASRARVEPKLGAAPGTARSPDGGSVVLPVARGLLVMTGKRARVLTGDAVAGASGCTAAKGGERVACVIGGEAVVLEGAEPKTPPAKAKKKSKKK